jgi:hypothetical protein
MTEQQETPTGRLRDALNGVLDVAETLMSEDLDLAKRLLALAEQAHDAFCEIEMEGDR